MACFKNKIFYFYKFIAFLFSKQYTFPGLNCHLNFVFNHIRFPEPLDQNFYSYKFITFVFLLRLLPSVFYAIKIFVNLNGLFLSLKIFTKNSKNDFNFSKKKIL